MRLYRTPAGLWAGTQDDAKALAKAEGGTWTHTEVPVDKPGLLAFLNGHRVGAAPIARSVEPARIEPARIEPAREERPPRDMSAGAALARMDNPGIDVDGICETIGKAKGYALKRYAGAVAVAFQAIAVDHR